MIQKIYNKTIRPLLPRKLGMLNGVTVRAPRLLDATDVNPDYEGTLISSLSEQVEPSDDVVVVGGGFGPSSVVAARHGRHVTTYEAGADRFRCLKETLRLNKVSRSVDAHHAVVGPAVSVKGTAANKSVHPTDLPDCDVLMLDCEGAEIEILENLDIRPRVIICECHAVFDAPESDVREQFDRLGYNVVDRGVEVPDKGIYVLTALSENA